MDAFIDGVAATIDAVAARKRSRKRVRHLLRRVERLVPDPPHGPGDAARSTRPGPRIEDTYSTLDAVVVGDLLISLLNHADRVGVACLAQLVNVIAPIRTEPGGPAWRQTTFHPFAAVAADRAGPQPRRPGHARPRWPPPGTATSQRSPPPRPTTRRRAGRRCSSPTAPPSRSRSRSAGSGRVGPGARGRPRRPAGPRGGVHLRVAPGAGRSNRGPGPVHRAGRVLDRADRLKPADQHCLMCQWVDASTWGCNVRYTACRQPARPHRLGSVRRKGAIMTRPVRVLAITATALLVGAFVPAASSAAEDPDPRIGLGGGWLDAQTAISNLQHLAHVDKPAGFVNPANPGSFAFVDLGPRVRRHPRVHGQLQRLQHLRHLRTRPRRRS